MRVSVAFLGLFACIFGFLVFLTWPAGEGGFYLDSEGLSRSLPDLREANLSWDRVGELTRSGVFPGGQRRPVATLTFLAESKVFGFVPRSARSLNILLHALNAALLFLLTLEVLRFFGIRPGEKLQVPLLSAVLWAANPFHADAVLYSVQRMTLLCTTLSLLATWAYLRARSADHASFRWRWWVLCGLSTGLALGSKESAILLPLCFALLEWLAPKPQDPREARARRARIAALVMLAPALALLLAIIFGVSLAGVLGSIVSASDHREFSAGTRLLTEGRVLVHYLTLFFFPLGSRLTFILKYELSQSLWTPWTTGATWALIGGLIAAAVGLRKQAPLVSLAVLWFFVNHLLESSLLPLELAFIHRNYFPSVFLLLPAVAWVWSALAEKRRGRALVGSGVVFLLVFASLGWYQRAGVWGNPERFWQDAIEKSPGSLRSYINLGVIADLQGRHLDALRIYRQGESAAVEETDAAWSSLYCCVGIASMSLGEYEAANQALLKGIKLTPLPDCLLNLAKLHLVTGNPAGALEQLERLERIESSHRKIYFYRAIALHGMGKVQAAREAIEEELRRFPGNPDAQRVARELGVSTFE